MSWKKWSTSGSPHQDRNRYLRAYDGLVTSITGTYTPASSSVPFPEIKLVLPYQIFP
jgi:hypothetical protein